jgi:hypothetical protein
MALTSYSGLVTYLESLLNRTDQTSLVPDFLTMAEAHFNRTLRTPAMEATATSATTSATVALPTDFLQAREVYIDGDNDTVLIPMDPALLRGRYALDTAGEPEAYTISGSDIVLAPAPSEEVDVGLAYYQKIPALTSTNTSNWLLESHPDIYVWGARYYAAEHARDDELAARCLGVLDGLIASINAAGVKQQMPAGPLAMRPATSE